MMIEPAPGRQPAATIGSGAQKGCQANSPVFNPAPIEPLPDAIYPLCDYIVPNKTEACAIFGFPLVTLDDARRAGDTLLVKAQEQHL